MSPQILDVGWPELHAPPLDKVCTICKAQESWLHSDPQHVVVIHCRVSPPPRLPLQPFPRGSAAPSRCTPCPAVPEWVLSQHSPLCRGSRGDLTPFCLRRAGKGASGSSSPPTCTSPTSRPGRGGSGGSGGQGRVAGLRSPGNAAAAGAMLGDTDAPWRQRRDPSGPAQRPASPQRPPGPRCPAVRPAPACGTGRQGLLGARRAAP